MNDGIILQHVYSNGPASHYPLLALTVPIHASYAKKHGFDYQANFTCIMENQEYYSKIKLMLNNVDKYKYIIWLDDDVMIIDDKVDLRSAFKNDLNAVLFDKPRLHYNAGVFYFKGNKKVGEFGEILARNYLAERGYDIIDTNVKISYQEIDIIARYNKLYIFIEVKTRTSDVLGKADESINSRKINYLKKAIEEYLENKKIDPNFIRLDFIGVDIDKRNKVAKIKHYKDIL